MATGGLSFPALGTDGAGLRLLEALGHTLHQPYPALTPLRGTHVAAAQLAGECMALKASALVLLSRCTAAVRGFSPRAEGQEEKGQAANR